MNKPTKEQRLDAAREFSRWHLGTRAWADDILNAYNNPVQALTKLARDQGDYTDEAQLILNELEPDNAERPASRS